MAVVRSKEPASSVINFVYGRQASNRSDNQNRLQLSIITPFNGICGKLTNKSCRVISGLHLLEVSMRPQVYFSLAYLIYWVVCYAQVCLKVGVNKAKKALACAKLGD